MSNHNQSTNLITTSSKGFTLIELLIVAPIIILVIGAFITMIVSMTGTILATRGANAMSLNIQDALNRIETDVKMSGAYLATNNVAVVSPQGYNNDTTVFQSATAGTTVGPMLILNSYTTTKNPVDPTRNLIYKNSPNACGGDLTSQNAPLVMNVVYFIKNNSLWRRTIANDATGCSVPWQQPSCAPGIVNAICKTQDIRLVDGVSPNGGFVIEYYTSINPDVINTEAVNTATGTNITRQAGLQLAKTAKVTINTTATISGRDVAQSGSIIVISPNNNATN